VVMGKEEREIASKKWNKTAQTLNLNHNKRK
jgi:hypothetical protein